MPVRLFPALFLTLTLAAAPPPKLAEARGSADLARFIYAQSRAKVPPGELLKGLESLDKVSFEETGAIPVAEIYAAAVEVRYRRELGEAYPAFGKRLEVRTFCAFRGRKGAIYRYPVLILGESERGVLKELLGRLANQCPLHKLAMVRAEISLRFGKPLLDPDYSAAREQLFPNAREACALAGCAVIWKNRARVAVCPDCDKARWAWLAEHPVKDIRVK